MIENTQLVSVSHARASTHTILFLDHTATLSGGELALLELVQRLDRSVYTPVVVLSSDGPLRERMEQAGIETHVLPLSPEIVKTRKDSLGKKSLLQVGAMARIARYALRLAVFMKRRGVKIVHCNSLKADVIGGVAGRMAGIPVIWHIRDRIEPDYLPGKVVRLFRALCRSLPTCIVANSEATLQTLHLPPAKRSAIVYSGVVLPEDEEAGKNEASANRQEPRSQSWQQEGEPVLPDSGEEGRSESGFPEGEEKSVPLIGLVGRISPWKGQHIFIQAAAKVRARFPDARFQIIGSALFSEEAYEQELRVLAHSLGLEKALTFTGFQYNIMDWIGAMDVLVHASTTGEPFGQVVVQGMVAGKPVVATRGGGVLEIVEDGVTGFLVPMGDVDAMAAALERLLSDTEMARCMGQAGRARVEQHFTIQQTIEAVQRVYQTLLPG